MADANSFESPAHRLVGSPDQASPAHPTAMPVVAERRCHFGICFLPDVDLLEYAREDVMSIMTNAESLSPALNKSVQHIFERQLTDIETGMDEAASAIEHFHELLYVQDRISSPLIVNLNIVHYTYLEGATPDSSAGHLDNGLSEALAARRRQSRTNSQVRALQSATLSERSAFIKPMLLAEGYGVGSQVLTAFTDKLNERKLHDIYARALPDPRNDPYDRQPGEEEICTAISEGSVSLLRYYLPYRPDDATWGLVSRGTELANYLNKSELTPEQLKTFEDSLEGYCSSAGSMASQTTDEWIHQVWLAATSGLSVSSSN